MILFQINFQLSVQKYGASQIFLDAVEGVPKHVV
jgi:hypothetical protein